MQRPQRPIVVLLQTFGYTFHTCTTVCLPTFEIKTITANHHGWKTKWYKKQLDCNSPNSFWEEQRLRHCLFVSRQGMVSTMSCPGLILNWIHRRQTTDTQYDIYWKTADSLQTNKFIDGSQNHDWLQMWQTSDRFHQTKHTTQTCTTG